MSIYDQHDTAFKNVTACVVTDHAGKRVETTIFKCGTEYMREEDFYALVERISSALDGGILKAV